MDPVKEELITKIVESALNALGYDLIRTLLSGKKRLKLQIMIDRLDGTPLTMDDCVKASRHVSSLLDVEDPIETSYDLEVSSPGLDRPLRIPKDLSKYEGEKIKLNTLVPFENRKRFQGILKAVGCGEITFISDDSDVPLSVRFEDIQKANLLPDFERFEKGRKQKRTP